MRPLGISRSPDSSKSWGWSRIGMQQVVPGRGQAVVSSCRPVRDRLRRPFDAGHALSAGVRLRRRGGPGCVYDLQPRRRPHSVPFGVGGQANLPTGGHLDLPTDGHLNAGCGRRPGLLARHPTAHIWSPREGVHDVVDGDVWCVMDALSGVCLRRTAACFPFIARLSAGRRPTWNASKTCPRRRPAGHRPFPETDSR